MLFVRDIHINKASQKGTYLHLISSKRKWSWFQAYQMCKAYRGHLPIFLDKYDVQEFTFLYKQMQCAGDEESDDR